MSERNDTLPDGAGLAREIHIKPGVGMAAHVLQGRDLQMLRMRVDQPALILVDRGIKSIRSERGAAATGVAGQALLVEGNQTVDFNNSVLDGSQYEARWLLFDDALLGDSHYLAECNARRRKSAPLRLIAKVRPALAEAFERARQSLTPAAGLPLSIARQRVLEVMHWLLEDGYVVRSTPLNASTSVKVRALISGRLDADWPTDRVAAELALSEATLRRRLVAEGTTLTKLLVDARMSIALTLLQATAKPVSDIALSVGYESPSRFAIRFRERFGFAPTAVRGHERTL